MLFEICVRVKNKVGATTRLDAACTKRGDIIAIMRPRADWGTDIVEGDDWRICKVDIRVTLARALLRAEDGDFPHRERRKRRWKFSLSRLTQAQRDTISTNRRGVVDLSAIPFKDMVVLKGTL
tara:strand:+ start:2239 stop:2607 length:369 start_codon:yes stop_codon:yes gene_type:complete